MNYIGYIEAVFTSSWLSKFINLWVKKGNNFFTEKIIYNNFIYLKYKINFSGLFFFFEVLEKVKPSIDLKVYNWGRKKNKKIKAFPYFMTGHAQYKKGLGWLANAIKKRKELNLGGKIYKEFYGIVLESAGATLKKKKRVL
jgi:ribosomal protein S7